MTDDAVDAPSRRPASEPGAHGGGARPSMPTGPNPPANASTRQLFRNVASGYLGLAVALLLSFFLTPIVLRELGRSDYGLWVVITSLGTYIGLLDAGVATAAVQQIASSIAVGDDARLGQILATAQVFFMVTGLLAVAGCAVFVPFLGAVFGVSRGSLPSAQVGLVLMGVFTGFGFLTSIPRASLYGGGRSDRMTVVGIGLAIATQGGQIAVVLLGGGLVGLFVVSAAGGLVGLVATTYVARRTGLMRRGRHRPTRAVLGQLLRSGWRNVLIAVAGTIAWNLDTNFTNSISSSGTALLLPSYAHSSALHDQDRQFRLYSKAVLFSMALAIPLVVALIAFGQALLRLWLGAVPPHTYQVLVALNIMILLAQPGAQSFVLLVGIGRNGLLAALALPAAIGNLGLSVAATFWLGPVGPAIGSLPQVVILEFVILPVVCCRTLGVAWRRYALEALLPLGVPLAVSVAAAGLLLWLMSNGSETKAPFEAVIVAVLAWGAFLAVVIRIDPAVRQVARQALHRPAPPERLQP
jgi:O-antigen/teichoic acid export membrane protein